ncbi:hypothetical protein BV61_03010 [Candidatus Synechococcus spongiarum LMB bulk15M]|uniref:Transposase putative helix-turn-helix domain-containing protein n=1 Tax=Candidatus Synechococcus spongiarum LMB bulk15M TaxID=1943582 RepID=A0A1T1D0F4_9SYNE|nr:hypothetical protein BV61_03010 [Candidatus Synechococcus spongiarum LMB bulk15M]
MPIRYRYRCYPDPVQKTLMAKAFGCARVVWNDALALNRQLYEEKVKPFDAGELMKRCSTQAKRSEERSWLAESSHTMLQQSLRDLSQAFKNWWKGTGRVRAPRFKSRRSRQSMGVCGRELYPTDKGVRFPKVGELKLKWSRPLPSPPTSVTLLKECSGR